MKRCDACIIETSMLLTTTPLPRPTLLIPVSKPSITGLEKDYVTNALASGWVSSQGEYLEAFEEAFAQYCGTRYALAVANATVGLHLVLTALGVGPGDEVIVPDFTFVATANAVHQTGAKAVFADINPESLCIDSSSVRSLITERTKALVPVHLYGHPCDMQALNDVAKEYGLFVVEDAAEAHGAKIKEQKVGSFGTAGVFSFYGNKIITTGEGGMITTNDERLFSKAKLLRGHAMQPANRYWHEMVGYNYRMTNLQAALGLAQLERIETIIEKRLLVFKWYSRYLEHVPLIKLNSSLPHVRNVCWMICMQAKGMNMGSRALLMSELKDHGVDTRPFFYPVSDMPMYSRANTPVAHEVHVTGINLPTFYDLQEADVEYICSQLAGLLDICQKRCWRT